jgi:cell division septation protein DedD
LVHHARLILLALLCCTGFAVARQPSKGYVVQDRNGKGVYVIPECIAEKAVNSAMSQPGLKTPPPAAAHVGPPGEYVVQVGAFALQANAARIVEGLTREGYDVRTAQTFFPRRCLEVTVVSAGPFSAPQEAEEAARRINARFRVTCLILTPGAADLASQ